jgi:hypothetical protein
MVEDCVVCGEAVTAECKGYKCSHGHEYHRICLTTSTKKKVCLVCETPVKLPYAPRAPRRLDRKPRSALCKGKTAVGKKCRNRTFASFCHLHAGEPSVESIGPTDAAVTINI